MAERVSISQWAQRWYYVVASHRPSQLGWRAYKLLQRRFFPPHVAPLSDLAAEELRPRKDNGLEQILQRHLSLRAARGSLSERAHALLSGEFCFLNQPRQLGPLGDRPLADVEPVSHLWRFHLQYQEYLLDLVAATQLGDISEAQERVWPIIEAWMKTHPIGGPVAVNDAWHPFCLSRRIAVWLMLWHAGVIPVEHRESFLNRLEQQTRFLERHLEWDLRGNHLFENLRTLILAGAAWEGEAADRRLDHAIRLCEGQIREQILPGGEHFERSPMYHAQILSAVLDIRDATEHLRPAFAETCRLTGVRMADLLGRQLHPDGQVPLLSDSAIEETPCPAILVLHALSAEQSSPDVLFGGVASLEMDGYWTWRDADHFLLFDRGPVGADELPAHAHNDLLTIEASLHGQRVIVDSGVFDYEDSEMRRYCRSTAAHNVMQVGGAEQCDLWSRFRMGRRGRLIASASGSDGPFSWTAATHDAFTQVGVPRVGRWIACRAGGPWIIADWADGKGSHTLDHWIHLAPDVEVALQEDQTAELTRSGLKAQLRFHTAGTLSLESRWYCPDFGVRLEVPVIRFQRTNELPSMVVWTLEWDEPDGDIEIQSDGQNEHCVIWRSEAQETRWTPQTLV